MHVHQPSARLLRRVAIVLALAVAGACGRFHGGGANGPAIIIFQNQSLDQADVYAVVPGVQTLRIGTVMAGRTDTLTVPADVTSAGGSVNIVARLLARNIAPGTGPVSIYAGQVYQVTLPPDEKLLSFLPQ